MPKWLEALPSRNSNWSGLILGPDVNHVLRNAILKKTASLLDMRNYLFSRQCAMLLKVGKPWEVRTLQEFTITKVFLRW